MPRSYLGISPKGPTVFNSVRRGPSGEPQMLIDENAATTLRINFSDWLQSGETITAHTITPEQCTVTATLSSPNLDLVISAVTSYTSGKITFTATSSGGDVYRQVIRVRRPSRFTDESVIQDYS
jgi:hypothetical protein